MSRFIPALLFALMLSPAAAQDLPRVQTDEEGIDEGMSLMQEGARSLLRGLMGEVEPQMRDLAEALREWDLNGFTLDDLGAYHPPERLPNGDIIIRRKSPTADEPLGEIEL